MNRNLIALFAASALAFTFACGDSETTATTATTNGGNGGNGASGGSTGGTGGTADTCVDANGDSKAMSGDCQAACEILFCCAEQECAGLNPEDKDAYVAGCVPTCMNQAALIAVVNGEKCATTVSTVRGADTSGAFAETCDNGIPMGGAGGTGGAAGGAGGAAGGAGGAGGN